MSIHSLWSRRKDNPESEITNFLAGMSIGDNDMVADKEYNIILHF